MEDLIICGFGYLRKSELWTDSIPRHKSKTLIPNKFASYDRMGFVRAARVTRRRFFL